MNIEKTALFETVRPSKALAIMALPTIASQMILLVYNLADAWFIGRTNNPYMIAASSLALTVYLATVALANVFGVGGGSLMVRLLGEKKTDEARNVCSLAYFLLKYHRLREKTVLTIPHRFVRIEKEQLRALYTVGVPAAFAIFLFDLVTIVINRLTAAYGDIPLAALGIVLKLERIPINVGLGVCLGMVPLVAYNYGSGNRKRLNQVLSLARIAILAFSAACRA